MTESDYTNQINQYNANLADYEEKLKAIQAEIDEAEDTLKRARNYSERFYGSVDTKKLNSGNITLNNGLKMLARWANEINEKLTGTPFYTADQNLQDMIEGIKTEIRNLYDDYDHYEELIEKTGMKLQDAQDALNALSSQQSSTT